MFCSDSKLWTVEVFFWNSAYIFINLEELLPLARTFALNVQDVF